MRACSRARWNFLSPNFVKSKLKGRMSLCSLWPEGCATFLGFFECLAAANRIVQTTYSGALLPCSLQSVPGRLRAAQQHLCYNFLPAAFKLRLHPTLPPHPLSLLAIVWPLSASRSCRLYTAALERSTFKQGTEYNDSPLSEKRLCPPPDGLASVFSLSDI